MEAVVGVDVGTGSARAGVFDLSGRRLGAASREIAIWRPRPGYAQQSSGDIWSAVVASVREALAEAGLRIVIRGLGFDATCSMVVSGPDGTPVSVDPDGAATQDILVWMDHRARAEADEINAGAHDVLRYVGGRISLEMQVPKLLWLKRHLPTRYAAASSFTDLSDWLTWRATGDHSRSLCSTVCKWTYLGHENRWDGGFFEAIGLGDLAREEFGRLGRAILPMGAAIGPGLSARAAAELGLSAGTPVGASAIDAHAGGIGTIGATIGGETTDLSRRLALVCGTSNCHMAVSAEPRFVPGVWGPYFSAMVPGLWLNEGGQSATGALIDRVIDGHAEGARLRSVGNPYEALNAVLAGMGEGVPASITRGLHVLPYFHGNRSPRADATLRGMIDGLTLDRGVEELAVTYLATIQAIAYGTRHILETLNQGGYAIETILACGGLTKNAVFLREHADATGCALALPEEPDAVLLGAAVLGAVAGGAHPDVAGAMAAMTRARIAVRPQGGETARYHAAKYAVFRRMYEDQKSYRDLMA